jgi:hypothetical protein
VRGITFDVQPSSPLGKRLTLAQLSELEIRIADETGGEYYDPLQPPGKAFEVARDFERLSTQDALDAPFRPIDGKFNSDAVEAALELARRHGPITHLGQLATSGNKLSVAHIVVEALWIAGVLKALDVLARPDSAEWEDSFRDAKEAMALAADIRGELTPDVGYEQFSQGLRNVPESPESKLEQRDILTRCVEIMVSWDLLNGNVVLRLKTEVVDGVIGLVRSWSPANLRGAIWAEIAQLALGSAAIRRCEFEDCGRLFVARSPRSLAKYCPPDPDRHERGCQVKNKEQRAYQKRKQRENQNG